MISTEFGSYLGNVGSTMRLFTYKLTNDSGFAPNPFWGVLTLATCKPGFRRSKLAGDWIAGFTSGKLCGDDVGIERLIFLMKINEKMPIAEYYRDRRFKPKIPDISAQQEIYRAGDNIYEPLCPNAETASDFRLVPNKHHDERNKQHDLRGKNVLIGKEFVYFGRNKLTIPPDFRPNVPRGQSPYGAKTRDIARARQFIEFVMEQASMGRVHGPPHEWPEGDGSWKGAL